MPQNWKHLPANSPTNGRWVLKVYNIIKKFRRLYFMMNNMNFFSAHILFLRYYGYFTAIAIKYCQFIELPSHKLTLRHWLINIICAWFFNWSYFNQRAIRFVGSHNNPQIRCWVFFRATEVINVFTKCDILNGIKIYVWRAINEIICA